ncbi:MAG TPA: hypothetical protein VGN64_13785, partial [Dyadobacter sp.]|nr:hypothetical protein [Dyadobacter sp.]
LLLFYSLSQSIQQYYTPGAIIHSVPKHSVISYRKGNTLFIQSDSAFVNDEDAYDFRIANYAVNSGVLHTVYLTETKRTKADDPLFGKYANGDLVVWAGRVINRGAFSANRAINYQLVTEKEPSLRDVSTSVVLLGGEIRYRKADRWKEFLLANDIAFHDLAQSAYRIPE